MCAAHDRSIDVRRLPGAKERYIVREQGYFPVLALLPDEDVVAVLRGGAGHVGITGRLDLVRSSDGGETWMPPETIVDRDRDDRNPALGVSKEGALVLGYHVQGCYDIEGKYMPEMGKADTAVTRSHDGGRTWEKPFPLSYAPLNGRSPFGKILTLPDGTLLMPIYGRRTGRLPGEERTRSEGACCSYLLRSRDGGRTWGDASLVAVDLNEGIFLMLPKGEILAAIRSERREEQALYICRSKDDGYSWTEPMRVTEPREHPGDLLLLSNGYVLLIYGHRHPPFGVQGMISRDGGHTWEAERKLVFNDDRSGTDCGYPSSVRLPKGRIITAYYSAGDHMDAYRGDGAYAMAVCYDEKELVRAVDA